MNTDNINTRRENVETEIVYHLKAIARILNEYAPDDKYFTASIRNGGIHCYNHERTDETGICVLVDENGDITHLELSPWGENK